MGKVREYWMDMIQSEKEEWLERQLGENYDRNSDEWMALAAEYDMQVAFYEEQMEIDWIKKQNINRFINTFRYEIKKLRDILEHNDDQMYLEDYCKMIYAHAVTLLETFLLDTIKSLLINVDDYLKNSVKNINELKEIKPTLHEIAENKNIVKEKVLKWLVSIQYHNLPKVLKIYELAIGKEIDVNLNKIMKVISIRHDIAHRNGKDTNDNNHTFSKLVVRKAIDTIEEFAESIQMSISNNHA